MCHCIFLIDVWAKNSTSAACAVEYKLVPEDHLAMNDAAITLRFQMFFLFFKYVYAHS